MWASLLLREIVQSEFGIELLPQEYADTDALYASLADSPLGVDDGERLTLCYEDPTDREHLLVLGDRITLLGRGYHHHAPQRRYVVAQSALAARLSSDQPCLYKLLQQFTLPETLPSVEPETWYRENSAQVAGWLFCPQAENRTARVVSNDVRAPSAPTATGTTVGSTPTRRAETSTPAPTQPPTPTTTPSPTATSLDSESIIATIRERGRIVAGVKVDARPFGFRQEGAFAGFEVDLIRALAHLWFDDPEAVDFVPVTSGDRMEKLMNREIDLIAATMTHNKARDEFIDFSQTYFLDGQNILVRADAGIESIDDLRGKRIAAVEGSTSIDQIREFVLANDLVREDPTGAGIEADIEIVAYSTYLQAVPPLLAGDVDALTTDRGILVGVAQAVAEESPDSPALTLLLAENFSREPYGLGLPTGDSYFANLVNFSLQTLKENGTYDALYAKWFGNEGEPYPIELLPGTWSYTLEDSPTLLDREVESVVERLIEDGAFVAGVKYDVPLFGFRNREGQVTGFEIDLMREFARRWLGNPDAVQFVQVTSSDRIEKLANGEVDIIAATMTHTQPRDELIDFSQTYYLDGQNILVHKEAGITTLEELDGKVVAAITGSTSLERMVEYAAEHELDVDIAEFTKYSEAIRPLLNGDVHALTTDRGILLGIAQSNPELTVLLAENFSQEPYGLGVANFDHRFRDLVNFTLQEMAEDGTYATLYRHWFGDNSTPFSMEVWPGQNYLTTDLTPMLHIAPGEFMLGRDAGERVAAVEYDAQPSRRIFLDSYYMDQYEVTNRLYRRCVDAGVCSEPEERGILRDPEYYYSEEFANHPVIYVNWEDALTYCGFAGKTLPSELQWEKAARGPYAAESDTLYLFPWGDTYDHNFPQASYNDNFIGFPRQVGSFGFPPAGVSPFGVHDMAGNVREWTADCYVQKYYETLEDGAENPPANTSCQPDGNRVVRGGGWNEEILDLTTTRRQSVEPQDVDRNLGFRCISTTAPTARFREDVF